MDNSTGRPAGFDNFQIQVPEPNSLALFAGALFLLGAPAQWGPSRSKVSADDQCSSTLFL